MKLITVSMLVLPSKSFHVNIACRRKSGTDEDVPVEASLCRRVTPKLSLDSGCVFIWQRMEGDFEASFDAPYRRYDWKRAGRVGVDEFVRSTIRCGFPFTRAQVNHL